MVIISELTCDKNKTHRCLVSVCTRLPSCYSTLVLLRLTDCNNKPPPHSAFLSGDEAEHFVSILFEKVSQVPSLVQPHSRALKLHATAAEGLSLALWFAAVSCVVSARFDEADASRLVPWHPGSTAYSIREADIIWDHLSCDIPASNHQQTLRHHQGNIYKRPLGYRYRCSPARFPNEI